MQLQRNPLPWETLSDEEWDELWNQFNKPDIDWFVELTEAVEKKLKEKNT